jgi:aspartyl-tRNA(Asn)/glutamyl-tRNA(Gln) amidotransferase subunit A
MGEFGLCDLPVGEAPYALCNDLWGYYRKQAAESNRYYIHPTYGTVSRYGLIPTATSMDQIGVLCKDVREGFNLLSIIAGHDKKDGVMFSEESYSYNKSDKKLTVGIPSGFADFTKGEAVQDFCRAFHTKEIALEYTDVYTPVQCILSNAEISGSLSRYDGIKYGFRANDYNNLNELYINSRSQGFGREVKTAIILGNLVLSQSNYNKYYDKAMKIRRLIKESLTFDGYDLIILPHDHAALTALAGLPSVTFSYKEQGIQLLANVKNESALLTACEVCHE